MEPRLPLGTIQRRVSGWPGEAPSAPPEPPPPVEFPFPVELPLRRSIPPPPVPPPPPPDPPGYSKPTRFRRVESRLKTPPSVLRGAKELPVPQLLRDLDHEGASERHTQVLLNLFAQHELSMQTTLRNAAARGRASRAAPSSIKAGDRKDRVNIEREEMAMRRKILLRPQSRSRQMCRSRSATSPTSPPGSSTCASG